MVETGLNATAAALLGLLLDGPRTGGQLMADAEHRLGPFWTMTRSQVYRELPVLADRGYLRAGRAGPRASQPYTITAAGKRAFQRWIAEPAGRDQLRSPLLLRAAFGAHHTDRQLAALYEDKATEHTQTLAATRDRAKQAKRDGDPFAAAVLEAVVAYHRAMARWLESAPGR